MPLDQEIGEDGLVEHRRVLVGSGPRRDQPLLQIRRHDQKAETQGREKCLAEAAHVDDAAIDVETVQAGDGPGAVAELAVVVVLDHPGARAARPVKQGQPASQAHRDAQRILMRRRHVHEAGIARAPRAHRDVQALGIHRDGENARARSQESAARPGVARVFHPHPVTRIEQHPADQLEALLSPGHDQDLVCLAACSASRLDVIGDRFTQRAQTGRLAVVELGRGDRSQPAAREPRPERDRKQIHTGRPDAEGARGSIEPVCALRGRHQRSPATRQGRMLHSGGPGGPPAYQIVRELRRHERPGSAAPGEIALGLELLYRQQRGRARHPEVVRQGARRGQPHPRAHDAVEDGSLDGCADLPLQPSAVARVQADEKARGRFGGGHTGVVARLAVR